MITAQSQTPPYRVSFTDGEHEAIADAAEESGGGNSSFSPHAYLEAALATCVTMTVRMYADRRNIPLTNVQTKVRLEKGASEESVFQYEVLLEGELTPEQREKLAYIATVCPVRRSLTKPIRFVSEPFAAETLEAGGK